MYAQLIMFTSDDMILNFRVCRVLFIKNKNGTLQKSCLMNIMYLHNSKLKILKKV